MGNDTDRKRRKGKRGRPRTKARVLTAQQRRTIGLVRRAIDLTRDPDYPDQPIPDRIFAQRVLRINDRTLRGYLYGEHPVPGPVLELCERIVAESATS